MLLLFTYNVKKKEQNTVQNNYLFIYNYLDIHLNMALLACCDSYWWEENSPEFIPSCIVENLDL